MFCNIKATLSDEWIKNKTKSNEDFLNLFEEFDDVNINYEPKIKSYNINCDLKTFDLIKTKFHIDSTFENTNVNTSNNQNALTNGYNISDELINIEKNVMFDSDIWDYIINIRGNDLHRLKTKYNFNVIVNTSENGLTSVTFIQNIKKNNNDKLSEFGLVDEAIELEENEGYIALMQLYTETENENTVEIYQDPIQKFLINIEEDMKHRYPDILLKRNYEVGGISIIGNQKDAKMAKIFYRKTVTLKNLKDYIEKFLIIENIENTRINYLNQNIGLNNIIPIYSNGEKNINNDNMETNFDLIEKENSDFNLSMNNNEYNLTKRNISKIKPEKINKKLKNRDSLYGHMEILNTDSFPKQIDNFEISISEKILNIDNLNNIEEKETENNEYDIISIDSSNNHQIKNLDDLSNLEMQNEIYENYIENTHETIDNENSLYINELFENPFMKALNTNLIEIKQVDILDKDNDAMRLQQQINSNELTNNFKEQLYIEKQKNTISKNYLEQNLSDDYNKSSNEISKNDSLEIDLQNKDLKEIKYNDVSGICKETYNNEMFSLSYFELDPDDFLDGPIKEIDIPYESNLNYLNKLHNPRSSFINTNFHDEMSLSNFKPKTNEILEINNDKLSPKISKREKNVAIAEKDNISPLSINGKASKLPYDSDESEYSEDEYV